MILDDPNRQRQARRRAAACLGARPPCPAASHARQALHLVVPEPGVPDPRCGWEACASRKRRHASKSVSDLRGQLMPRAPARSACAAEHRRARDAPVAGLAGAIHLRRRGPAWASRKARQTLMLLLQPRGSFTPFRSAKLTANAIMAGVGGRLSA